MNRRRPNLTTLGTVLAYMICVAAIAAAFVVQAQRIGVAEDLAQYRLSVVEEKEAQLLDLLNKYAALADDCEEAADCTTTTPPVEVIERTIEGAPGSQGPAGPGASVSQIAEQVRSYCGARDDCRGPTGEPGAAGPSGANGTDSTVPGPQGDPGPPGAPGADGRSVTDNQCIGEGDTSFWQTTYSDGSTTTSPRPCRLASSGIDILN